MAVMKEIYELNYLYLQTGYSFNNQDGRFQLVDGVRSKLPPMLLLRSNRHYGEYKEGDGLRQDSDTQFGYRTHPGDTVTRIQDTCRGYRNYDIVYMQGIL